MFKAGLAFVFDILQTIVLAGAIFVVTYLFIAQPNNIKGASMEKSFNDGDYILTEKVSYRFGEPQRGDIVVFESPTRPDVDYIKRIIALPGETISISDGEVYINGTLLDEEYEDDTVRTASGKFLEEDQQYTVPEDSYFVLGDNRPRSSDSREFGIVEKDHIVGKAIWCYWPRDCFGKITLPNYNI